MGVSIDFTSVGGNYIPATTPNNRQPYIGAFQFLPRDRGELHHVGLRLPAHERSLEHGLKVNPPGMSARYGEIGQTAWHHRE